MKVRTSMLLLLLLGLGTIAAQALASTPFPQLAHPSDPFFPSRLSVEGNRSVGIKDFDLPEDCGECHEQIHRQWEGGMHANAWKDPAYTALHRIASQETKGMVDRYCIGCHAPLAVLAGEEGGNVSQISQKGVQCDFCHTVAGSKGIGNTALISSPGSIKRGPFPDSRSPAHETAFSELHTQAEFCGACHDVYHPLNGLPLEKTYTEWYQGPYRVRGIKCQDCHMTPGITGFQANPGNAGVGAPDREHIWTHNIVGANASMASLLGFPRHRQLAEERLRSAAKLEIIAPLTARAGEILFLQVKVSNTGAGHYLPTGLTESREMWLEAIVRDPTGRPIYSSGQVDEKGMIDEGTVIYHTVFADAKGKPVGARVWEADHLLWDHRIPPLGYALERFKLQLPEETKGRYRIEARLLYRSFPQSLVNFLLGDKAPLWPIYEMARSESWFEVR